MITFPTGWALVGLFAALSPLLAAAGAWATRRFVVDTVLSGLGLVAAVTTLVAVATDGPVRSLDGWVGFDRVASCWTVFALTIVWSIRAFAQRQLAADPLRQRFMAWSAAAATAGVALFVAANLVALACAAVLASAAVAGLVGAHLRGGPVRRRVITILAAGNAALVAALVAVMIDADTIDSSGLVQVDGPVLHLAALAIVIAALVACAVVPAHSWLLATLAAPTPASAMLHAGLVNAGGVILIRLAPLVSRSLGAVVVGLAVATMSMVMAVAVMGHRSEVKSALVWSTIAQMGFMSVQALVGLGAAAAAHLIAHGAYKSHLFLASGSTIEHPRPTQRVVTTAERAVGLVAAVMVVAVATPLSGYDITAEHGAAALIPIFAAATVGTVLSGSHGIDRRRATRSIGLVLALGILAFAYLGSLWRFEKWLELPPSVPSGAGVMVLVVAAAAGLGAWLADRATRDDHPIAIAAHARLVALSRPPDVGVASTGTTTGAA